MVFKVCYTCKKSKGITNFNFRNKNKGIRRGICKSCENIKHKEYRKEISDVKKENKKKKLEEYLSNLTEKKCKVCGEVKELKLFRKCKALLDGHDNICKCCLNKRINEKNSIKIVVSEKRCSKCKKILSIEHYDKNANKKDGLSCYCKKCKRKTQSEYRKRKREKSPKQKRKITKRKPKYKIDETTTFALCPACLEMQPNFLFTNREKRCKECTKNRIKVPKIKCKDGYKMCIYCNIEKKEDEFKKGGNACKSCVRIRDKEYRENNKEQIKKQRKENPHKYPTNKKKAKERYERKKNNPEVKIAARIRSAIHNRFNKEEFKKDKKLIEYGIEIDKIIEKLKYKKNKDDQIDHIIPLILFDYTNHEHIRLSQHPNNLRWISRKENIEKSDCICWSLIESDEVLLDIAKMLNITKDDDMKKGRDIAARRKDNAMV